MQSLGRRPDILISRSQSWIRWHLFFYIAGMLFGCQFLFLTELGWEPFPPHIGVIVVPAVIFPLSTVAAARRLSRLTRERLGLPPLPDPDSPPALARTERQPGPNWIGLGIALFLVWSVGYFLVGTLTADMEKSTLFLAIDRRMPLVPEFSLLYLMVYPMYLLPFFFTARRELYREIIFGYLSVILISYLTFVLFPVVYPREPLPVTDLSSYTLSLVQALDPPWNCFPSTHVATATIASLTLFELERRVGLWALAMTGLIGISTMLTRQHYALDVVAGVAIALFCYYLFFRRRLMDRIHYRLDLEALAGRLEQKLRELERRIGGRDREE